MELESKRINEDRSLFSLPQEIEKALMKVSRILQEAGIRWGLVGSTAGYLNGLSIKPRDIDIIVETSKVYEVDKIFAAKFYTLRRIQYSSSRIYSSHFGIFDVYGTRIEVMADLTICRDNMCLKVDFEDLYSCSNSIKIEDNIIRYAPIEWQLVANILIPGKEERVKAIIELIKNKELNIEKINHILKHASSNTKKYIMETIRQAIKINTNTNTMS